MLEKLPKQWRMPASYLIAFSTVVAAMVIFDSKIAGGAADSIWLPRFEPDLRMVYHSTKVTYAILSFAPLVLGYWFGRWDGVRLRNSGKNW